MGLQASSLMMISTSCTRSSESRDETRSAGYTTVFHEVIESFDRLRDRSALEIEPRTIHLYQVPRTMAFSDALRQAGMEEEHFDDLSLLNNTTLDAEVAGGDTIKVVRQGALDRPRRIARHHLGYSDSRRLFLGGHRFLDDDELRRWLRTNVPLPRVAGAVILGTVVVPAVVWLCPRPRAIARRHRTQKRRRYPWHHLVHLRGRGRDGGRAPRAQERNFASRSRGQ